MVSLSIKTIGSHTSMRFRKMENYESKVSGELLASLYELCVRAHDGVSHSPERRAVSYIQSYSKVLADDLALLGENTGNYREKFIEKFSAWMRAKSNCLSSMIAGPANFPVRRAIKANNIEHARSEDFINWRDKYFAAVNRQPRLSFTNDLEETERKLVTLEEYQENLKDLGKLLRKLKTDDEKAILSAATEKDIPVELLNGLDFYGGIFSVPRFRLTNNNAKIKATKEKIADLEARITIQENFEDINFTGGSISISDDRIKIFHDKKPEREIIDFIKKNGFNWSPFWGCWCRRLTGNALSVVRCQIVPRLTQ